MASPPRVGPVEGLIRRFQAPLPMVRALAALSVLLVVPALLALGALRDAGAIEVGRSAPRTVLAEDTIQIVDEEATQKLRAEAAERVQPLTAQDPEARSAIVDDARQIFTTTASVRTPTRPGQGGEPEVRSRDEQIAALLEAFESMDQSLAAALVDLDDVQLTILRADAVALAQDFARLEVTQEDLSGELESFLARELPLLDDDELARTIVAPVLEQVARATIRVDAEATAQARQEAADAVENVTSEWQPGDAIVTEGALVTEAAFEALQQSGLEGSTAPLRYLRALGAMLVVVVVLGLYLGRMQPLVWTSPRKLGLLTAMLVGYAGLVTGVNLLTDAGLVAWWYVVPVGALAMLVALLVQPVVAIASMLPAVVMVTLAAPLSNGVTVFTAAAVLVSVPLSIGIGSRGDLRSATFRAGLAMPVIAAVVIGVFGPHSEFVPAIAAAAINGILIVLLVQGLLPFLETTFRLPTVTALLDLADRNHPLLRELETKAIGSYNHSVMVASLTERACREIGADPLLGSVAALYHDIGKVRRPHFFIENQYGISNPHDDLEPEVSALIIQEHVSDGVRLAREYKLPPEVVSAIASHHGTMLVTFFYSKAVEAAGGDATLVDEELFRYKGARPKGKEAAVLLIADCSEAATRAMAMSRGTLPRGLIEDTVDALLQARVEDGQFDECELTFDELRRVRDSVVGALEGIYHPRIAYPGGTRPDDEPDVPGAVGDPAIESAASAPDPRQQRLPVPADDPVPMAPAATTVAAQQAATHDHHHIDWAGARARAATHGSTVADARREHDAGHDADHDAPPAPASREESVHDEAERSLANELVDIDGVVIPEVSAQQP